MMLWTGMHEVWSNSQSKWARTIVQGLRPSQVKSVCARAGVRACVRACVRATAGNVSLLFRSEVLNVHCASFSTVRLHAIVRQEYVTKGGMYDGYTVPAGAMKVVIAWEFATMPPGWSLQCLASRG
eukprot:2780393-Amphidinium_carterae.1